MVTAAGGDPRGTDPRVVDLQSRAVRYRGRSHADSAADQQARRRRAAVGRADDRPRPMRRPPLLAVVRDDVLPKVEAEPGGITSYVGGYTASYVDLADLISERLLLVIGTVILLGFLLLMVAFRSILVPLQAAVTNVLSAAAAFGVLDRVLPVGLGHRPRRHRHRERYRSDRQLRPADDVRGALRSVDGLRGLPRQPHPAAPCRAASRPGRPRLPGCGPAPGSPRLPR